VALEPTGDNPYAPSAVRDAGTDDASTIGQGSMPRARAMARVAGGLFLFGALIGAIGFVTLQLQLRDMGLGASLQATLPSLVWTVLQGALAAAFLRGQRRFRVPAIVLCSLPVVSSVIALVKYLPISRISGYFLVTSALRPALFGAAIIVLLTGRGTAGRFAVGVTLGCLSIAAWLGGYLIPIMLAARAASGL
jgi:hypothetical protein